MNLEKNRIRNDPAIRQHRENGRTGSYQWDEALARIFQAGWHEDIIDPNAVYTRKRPQPREAIEDFDPFDPPDFLNKICGRWNIALPPTDKTLL